MVRILNVEPEGYSIEGRKRLQELGQIIDGPLSRAELLSVLPDCDILLVRLGHQIDREVLEAGSKLKVIVSATTGLDHIDLETAATRGIAVLSLQGETDFLRGITATAELTWGLLLALMRHIPEAHASVRNGVWNRDALRGQDLAGKRLGIVGLGRVGGQVADYGMAFRMTVAAYDPYVTYWPPMVQRKYSLHALLMDTDVLSVHVNLHPGAIGLIGGLELALLRKGSVLLNTSRGEVIDEDALLEALISGHLAGAALDVVPGERKDEDRRRSRLIAYSCVHHNLLITPHIGGATAEAMRKTEVFMANKLANFLAVGRGATIS
ncbi:NAD(P)-dependent oxidoreductase [Nitrospira sp. Nam80]